MRIGIAAGLNELSILKGVGFDYVELSLNRVSELTKSEFLDLQETLADIGLRAEVFRDLLPDDLPITGNSVIAKEIHEYMTFALDRARRLGAEIIAIDGAVSRNVPNDCDFPFGCRQFGNFLRMTQAHLSDAGLFGALMPIRRAECNLLNYLSEAILLTSTMQLNRIGVLADIVQMELGSEPINTLNHAGELLWHVHTGNALTRRLPRQDDGEDYNKLFKTLRGADYRGRVSCISDKPFTKEEAAAALDCVRTAERGTI